MLRKTLGMLMSLKISVMSHRKPETEKPKCWYFKTSPANRCGFREFHNGAQLLVALEEQVAYSTNTKPELERRQNQRGYQDSNLLGQMI